METDRLFTCEFCKVKSYLLEGDFFRYILPDKAPKGKELIYFPYWRFKGLLMWCSFAGVEYRIIDQSFQAVESSYFPVSIGLRGQTLKLRFASSDTEGRFLKPGKGIKDIIKHVYQGISPSQAEGVFVRNAIGNTMSQIYSPFYVNGKVYDAILNRALQKGEGDFDLASFRDEPPDWRLSFLPALCPNCGWDMEGERDSHALLCKNCRSFYQVEDGKYRKIDFAHIPFEGDSLTCLPFWRMRVDISGINLNTYADLINVANLPRVSREEWKERGFYFWSPAFKIRPEDFLGLSRVLTLKQPENELVTDLPKTTLFPVTLPLRQAAQGLKITLASFIKPPNVMFPKLPGIKMSVNQALLVFIPFHERGSELIDPNFNLNINRNLLAFSKYL